MRAVVTGRFGPDDRTALPAWRDARTMTGVVTSERG
jgi:hypothetical protein